MLAGWALGVSVLALMVACASAWYTKVQADAARAGRQWEEARKWLVGRKGDYLRVTNNMSGDVYDVMVNVGRGSLADPSHIQPLLQAGAYVDVQVDLAWEELPDPVVIHWKNPGDDTYQTWNSPPPRA